MNRLMWFLIRLYYYKNLKVMDKATYTPLMCYAVSLIYFNLLGRKQTPLLRSFHDLPGPLRLVGKKMNGD